MTKKYLFLAVGLIALLLVGCTDKNKPVNPEPEDLHGNVARPAWTDPERYDFSSSMTALVKVDLASQYPAAAKDFQLHENDLMAAFIGDSCIGVAKKINSHFELFMTGTEGNVTLRFYSGFYSNLFVAQDAFTYHNDSNLGDWSKPFVPVFVLSK